MPLVFDLAEVQPGYLFPGAVAAEQTTINASAGAGAFIENYFGVASGGTLQRR